MLSGFCCAMNSSRQRMPLLLFACVVENLPADIRRDEEIDLRLQSVDEWCHGRDQARRLGVNQQAEHAFDAQAETAGHFTAVVLVDEQEAGPDLQGKGDRLRFTGIEILSK